MSWEVQTMRSKISSCKPSLPVMWKNFTRYWPIWGSYLAIWLLLLPLTLLRENDEWIVNMGESGIILPFGQQIGVVFSVIYGFLSAAAVWSYLYNHRSASLYHALPVSREGMFLSHTLSGLGLTVLPNVVVFLLSWLICMGRGLIGATPCLLGWLGAVCLQNLFFFCFATLLAMLTGNLPTHAVLYAVLNLAVFVCESLIRIFAAMLTRGLTEGEPLLVFLSPPVRMFREYNYNYNEESIVDLLGYPMLLAYAAAGVILLVLALLLYRRRDTERAGDVIAVPFLRPVAKYCFTFGCALVLGWILHQVIFQGRESLICVLCSLLLGGLIGYLAAAMLLKKSFRVFDKKTVAGFCVFALVVTAGLVGMKTDVFGAGRWVPRADQLSRAEVYCQNGYYEWLADDDPAKLDTILALHQASAAQRPGEEDATVTCTIEYSLTDGRMLRRAFEVSCEPQELADPSRPAGLLNRLLNDPDHLMDRILPPADARLASIAVYAHEEDLNPKADPYQYEYANTKDFQPLLDAIREDVLAGDYGRWDPNTDYREPAYTIEIEYALPTSGSTAYYARTRSYSLDFSRDEAPRTFALLQELGYLRGAKR